MGKLPNGLRHGSQNKDKTGPPQGSNIQPYRLQHSFLRNHFSAERSEWTADTERDNGAMV
jgi:hypothetical protein